MSRLRQTLPMIRFLILLCAAALLTACGFHLRNALVLPADLGPVRVVSPDPYSPLANQLERALEGAGAQIAPAPVAGVSAADAPVVSQLSIVKERWGDLPIAVDAEGRAQEYTLRYAVIFNLKDAQGRVVVPDQSIELGRDYVVPPTDSRGSASEREMLTREMRRDMVATVLRRIDSVVKADTPTSHSQNVP